MIKGSSVMIKGTSVMIKGTSALIKGNSVLIKGMYPNLNRAETLHPLDYIMPIAELVQ